MEKEYIAVMDSGIGGLTLLNKLKKVFGKTDFIYFGDNDNAPYGNKTDDELFSLTVKNISSLKERNIKAVVFGCNTLSVTVRKRVEDYFGIKVTGIYPPVESTLINYGKTLLLSTKATAERYVGIKGLSIIGLKGLASEIERRVCGSGFNKINFREELYRKDNFYYGDTDYRSVNAVILGCTHYLFVKNQIFDHFGKKVYIDGESNTVNMLKTVIKPPKIRENPTKHPVLFLGSNADYNKKIFQKVVDDSLIL